MADYNLKAEITADASGYEAGIKKAQKVSKNLSTTISGVIKGLGKNGLVGALGAVGLASQGLTSTLGAVVKIARRVSETVNECTNAYKNQLIAERELDTAIQNNPFVTGASADALKQFASEMQKVSNYGDEELIPMMANLVSLGRTEAETMQIMSVAMDMSAGMGISLDTAITQLNATLNGNIGRLGQQNAELKDLTEVELRSGKAIEILGEKFKGLSGATADTSKQLQNMKGDFKEALGQFTLPSSDMWNKFWIGFYEKGIEVINKINAFMDSQIIGKKLANAITEQIARINPADVGGRIDYTRSVLKVIGDEELEALKNYLSGLKNLSAEQEIILRRIKAEEDSRYQSSINAKQEAEAKKAQADVEAQITAEAERQAELASKKTDWASKLLDQRIEMLEAERDRAIQYAEEEGAETYSIWVDYNNKILELKLERLEKEKEKALEEEGLAAEDKIDIEEYYSGETQKIYNELGNYKKKKNDEEKKDEKSKFSIIVQYAKEYAKKIKQIIEKVVSTIKNVFSGIVNVFRNIFDFNPDDALDNLLAVEDAILTFFVETVPKLPAFFASAIQSIITLIGTLVNSIDWEKVQKVVDSIIDVIVKNAPTIVENLLNLVLNIAQTLINAIIHFVESGGWKMLLDMFLKIQMRIEQFVIDNIDSIVNTISDMLPDLINALIKSIVSASKTLGKLAPKILPLIADLINAIIEVITSDEVLDSANDAIEGIVDGLVQAIIKLLTKAIPKLINFAIKLLSPIALSKLVIAIVKGLIEGFAKTDWGQVVKDIFTAFIDAIKSLFGIHSPSTLFEGFGVNMVEGLWNGLKEMGNWLNENVGGFFRNMWNTITSVFSNVGEWFKNAFSNVGSKISEGLGNIGEFFRNIWNNITSVFSNVGDWFKNAFSNVGSKISEGFGNVGKWAENIWKDITKAFSNVGDWFKNTFESAGNGIKNAFNGLGKWFEDLWNNILNVMKAPINGIIDALNHVIDGFNSISVHIPDWVPFVGGKTFGINIAKIQKLANGTDNARSGLTLVGEAGPELVKFKGGEQVLNNRNTNKALANMGGTTINQNVTFNNLQDTTAFAMMNQLKQYNRQMAINGIF